MTTIAQAKAHTQNLLNAIAQRYSNTQVTYAPGLIAKLTKYLKHDHIPVVLYAYCDCSDSIQIEGSNIDEILDNGIPYTDIHIPNLSRPIMLGEDF